MSDCDLQEIIKMDQEYVFHHLVQHSGYLKNEPPVIVKGEGMYVTDAHGKKFLDATSGGVWAVNVGYGRKRIADAVAAQLIELCYQCMASGNVPAARLAKEIAQLMSGAKRRVFYSNSGSEANEKAFKIARQLGRKNCGNKYKIIYRHRDYHGTTFGAMSATGQEERKMEFGPFVPGFVQAPECNCFRCPFKLTYPSCGIRCATVVEDIIQRESPDEVAAMIIEPITSGGGVLTPVKEYFPILQSILRKYNVLLIVDEVVNGWGRTGTWFGYQNFDVDPDIVTSAKGLTSAYQPLSITVVKEELFNAFLNDDPDDKYSYFRDVSTYGGCTGSPAAALENIAIIKEENLIDHSAEIGVLFGKALRKKLGDLPVVGDIRGQGCFWGIELVKDKVTNDYADEKKVAATAGECYKNGLIVGRMNRSCPGKNCVIALAPPLIVNEEEINFIVDTLAAAIKNVFAC